jgi:hypothetical protein
MKGSLRSKIVLTCIAVLLLTGASAAGLLVGSRGNSRAASEPTLGTAATFAVLGASKVTNTGSTVLTGDLGVSPGTSCTGFPSPCTGGPGAVTGTIHAGDSVAAQAQTDAHTAYTNAAGQTCNVDLTGQDLGGKTLTPGVYCFSSSAQLTGTLTLDGQGNSNSVFIFQTGSTLTTASASKVVLINSASACNVFWNIGSSATLGTTTTFAGNILANISITATTGVTSNGSLYALSGAVTLDTNLIQTCSPALTSTPTPTITSTPTPTITSTPTPTMTPTPTPTMIPTSTPTMIPTSMPTACDERCCNQDNNNCIWDSAKGSGAKTKAASKIGNKRY